MIRSCHTCNDTGLVVWDDDQSRWRESSFSPNEVPSSCPDCDAAMDQLVGNTLRLGRSDPALIYHQATGLRPTGSQFKSGQRSTSPQDLGIESLRI